MTRTPKVDAFMLPGGWPFFTDGICAECRCEGKKHAKRFLCVECHEYLTPEEIAELYPRTFREFGKRALEELRTRPYDYLVDKCGRPFADAAIPPTASTPARNATSSGPSSDARSCATRIDAG